MSEDMPDPPDNQAEAASSVGADHNYRAIEWDEGKPLSEWHYTHRRAWILQNELVEKAHPDLVNWAELARRFDKSKSTLHRDKEVLTDFLTKDLDEDRIDLIGQTIFERGLRELLTPTTETKMRPDGSTVEIEKPPDYQAAADFYRMWVDTLARRGKTEWTPPEEQEDSEGTVEGGLREVYTEIAGVPPEDVDDLQGMPDRDKPPELVPATVEDAEPAEEGGT